MAPRLNRRATTGGRPVRDNGIWDVRVLVDGVGARRSPGLYYRRLTVAGAVYTGPVA